MRVLKFCEKYLTFCGILSYSKTGTTSGFLKSISTYIFFLGFIYSLIIVSGVYVYENLDNVVDSVNSCIQLSGGLAILGSYIGIGVNVKKIIHLNSEIQKIVDDGNTFFNLIFRFKF